MVTQFDKFIATMKKVLMLDQADLDFGIYRIMNQKRSQIETYLNNDLRKQVSEAIRENASTDAGAIEKELAQLVATLMAAGMNPDDAPKVKELKERIAQCGNSEELENEVYSHLSIFFSRYYDGGDFISQRRYKKDVYAIPYEGEEVKLHWANADQYYIKTSEYFRKYRFAIDENKFCEFTLREATTEQNNNVAQNNMERRFALYEESPIEAIGNTLHIYFTYELYPKTIKQKALVEKAFDVVKDILPTEFMSVLALCPSNTDRNRTLLQKHLNDYVARNKFDYFIHKDLQGFLSRELDFYIKNEILVIDDIDARTPDEFLKHLTVIKAIKMVGMKLITFLASLENYQKRLWLKKKFVVESNYCITLDHVPENLYSDIINNDAQREEWVRLFAIDEIKGETGDGLFNGGKAGYSVPLTVEFLKENPFLVLDTKFFTAAFKNALLKSIDNIDEQCDGLLINSENFQALELLQEKYRERVKSVFIDPPYNTEDSEGENDFNYKDNFQHSSWLSMYQDRMSLVFNMLSPNGILQQTISDIELTNLIFISDHIFNEENRVGIIEWNSTKSVTNTALISMGHTHIPLYAKDLNYYKTHRVEFRLPDTEDGFSNPDNDPRGKWKADPFQVGGVRPNQVYEITNPKTGIKYKPNPGCSWKNEYSVFQQLMTENRIVFGTTGEAGPQRKRFWFEAEERGRVPKTWWDDADTTTNGTRLLKNIFGECPFKNPKPVLLIEKLQYLCSNTEAIILDYFAGSGTTGHAVINLNREDGGKRKYILCEMGEYFDTVTKPRIQKVIYSKDWKDGKPVSREGSSHCFKYMRLEQYEDTLNNLTIEPVNISKDNAAFYDGYMLGYMLDIETRDSLFNLKWFRNPWNMKLRITRQNETHEEKIDVIETFNYLIGLNVRSILYPKKDICTVEGITRSGERTLVIWRNCDTVDNKALEEFFRKMSYSTRDNEFDRIYVNGDNNLENLRTDEDQWKVILTEQEFAKRMFEDC